MMLQREGSDACSWGWGNHLHTKHSKWLHQNLHEVEEKVERVLAEIEEDGDSFARRAEMYYKKRPQLIAFLHDFHRSYRSLAQRSHHLSVDLHSTSATLASLLPPPAFPNPPPLLSPSHEIDSLQKGILEMPAEKELVKACYEHGLRKYTQIDAMIVDTEKEVCGLQEGFDSKPDAALASFTDTLARLRVEQQHLSEEARAEVDTIKTMLTDFNININLEEEEEEDSVVEEAGGGDGMGEMTEEMYKLVSEMEKGVSILRDMVGKVQLEGKELREKREMNDGEDIVIKLDTVVELSRRIKEQKNNLRVCFADAHSNLHGLHHISSIESEKTAIHHFPSLSLCGDCGITTTKITESADKTGEDEENGDGEDGLTRISSFSFSYRGEEGEKKQGNDSGEEEPNWRDLFTRGMEEREKVLLDEYTSVLRSLKEVKSRLGEREEEMQKLRSENRRKEDEIELLTQRVKRLQCSRRITGEEEEEDIEVTGGGGVAGERLRGRIDEVLEQNLEFWLRFSTSLCQIQRFQKEVEEVEEGEERREIKKRLGEEMGTWLEEGAGLREELRRRQSSLEEIEGEIRGAVGEEDGEGRRFTAYEGAKLQGEVMNMKQENNKVGEELEAGMEHVSGLHQEMVRTITNGADEMLGPGPRKIQHYSWNKARVPIKSFIFGGRFRRQRPSSSSSSTINPISIFGLHRKRTPPTPPPLPTTT